MKFEEFKAEFDALFARVTDDELVEAFAKMGCEVELVDPPQVQPAWTPMIMTTEGEWNNCVPHGDYTVEIASGWRSEHLCPLLGRSTSPRLLEPDNLPLNRGSETVTAEETNLLILAA